MAYLKNIASSEVLKLADQVQYATGQVVSKTLVQNKGVGITLFAKARVSVNMKALVMLLLLA